MSKTWLLWSLAGVIVIVVAFTAKMLWPVWLEWREPVHINATWPVSTEEGTVVSLDSDTAIVGMSFNVQARFSSSSPHRFTILNLRKSQNGSSVIHHSQAGGFVSSDNQRYSMSIDVPLKDNIDPGTYELEIRVGSESVATRKVQIIERPPHIPRVTRKPEQQADDQVVTVPDSVADAVAAVLQGIADKHWPKIAQACHGAKTIHADQAVVQSLMELLEDDPNDDTRGLVFRAFWHMGPAAEPAIPALIEALDNPKLQDAACLALGSIGNSAQASMPRLIELYRAGKLNRAFLIAVRGIGPAAQEAVPDMIKLLRVPEEDSNFVQHGLKECFASIGPDACAALAEMLRDPDPGNRRRAAIVLEQMGAGAAPAVTALMASLDDTAARDWAAAALGRIGPEAELAIPALIRLLESDDFTVRVCAARALGEIGPASESAVPSLTTLLHDRELRVRVAADEALHRIEKREATDSQ